LSTVDQAITLDLDDEKFDRLIRALEKLPDKLYDKVVKRAAKMAVKPMMKIAKARAPHKSGFFKKSIISKLKTYKRNATVIVIMGPENKKDPQTGENPANIAHLIEYGTAAHKIVPRDIKSTPGMPVGGNEMGVLFRGSVNHPGIKAQPFMRPAYDLGRVASVERYRTELKKKFDSVVKSVS